MFNGAQLDRIELKLDTMIAAQVRIENLLSSTKIEVLQNRVETKKIKKEPIVKEVETVKEVKVPGKEKVVYRDKGRKKRRKNLTKRSYAGRVQAEELKRMITLSEGGSTMMEISVALNRNPSTISTYLHDYEDGTITIENDKIVKHPTKVE